MPLSLKNGVEFPNYVRPELIIPVSVSSIQVGAALKGLSI